MPIKSESCTPNDLQSLRSILTFIPDTLNYVQEPLSARTTRSDSAMLDNRDFLIPLHHSLIGPQAQMLICALCPINWQDCAFEIVDHCKCDSIYGQTYVQSLMPFRYHDFYKREY